MSGDCSSRDFPPLFTFGHLSLKNLYKISQISDKLMVKAPCTVCVHVVVE